MKINENKLAVEIAEEEGGKVAVNIGQIKEVVKILLGKLAEFRASEVMALIEKHE